MQHGEHVGQLHVNQRLALCGAAAFAAAALGGCFGPTIVGVTCGEDGECPPGLICDPVDDVCRETPLPPGSAPLTDIDTEITLFPEAQTRDATVTFGFRSNDPEATFECRTDAVEFAPCETPRAVEVGDGMHLFEVRAKSGDEIDPTPAQLAWLVDTTAPDTEITRAPAAVDNSVDVSIEFSSSEDDSTFECSAESGSFSPCTSPYSLTGLGEGDHSFSVRAIDALGNFDPSPAAHDWTLDASAPDTTIVSGPSGWLDSTSATFAFSSGDAAAFECQLDAGGWAACSSPVSYSGLAETGHTFSVRAVASTGEKDPTPAARSWIVDVTAPVVTITSAPADPSFSASASFGFVADEAAVFDCRLDGGARVSCFAPHFVTVADGAHTFEVRAVDLAGNTGAPAAHAWSVDTVLAGGPAVTITAGPPAQTSATTVTFDFFGEGSVLAFECQILGDLPWHWCEPPMTYLGGTPGTYTFEVRAYDFTGDLGPTASYSWTVTP